MELTPPSRSFVADHFRRTDPRYARRLDVEIVAGQDKRTAVTGNISLGGMFVETDQAFPLGTKLQIRFRIPTQPEPIEVSGEVRWIEGGGPEQAAGMGIRFQGLRAREVWALNRFFQV
jgi:uncharacterized protein (TIGR02266 family)